MRIKKKRDVLECSFRAVLFPLICLCLCFCLTLLCFALFAIFKYLFFKSLYENKWV